MGISPTYLGNLAPAWTIFLVPDSGVVNVSGLVAANFSLRIHNTSAGATPTETTGQGTFSNITAAVTQLLPDGTTLIKSHSSVQYQLVNADVVLGTYKLWCDVTFSNGVESFLLGDWQVISE